MPNLHALTTPERLNMADQVAETPSISAHYRRQRHERLLRVMLPVATGIMGFGVLFSASQLIFFASSHTLSFALQSIVVVLMEVNFAFGWFALRHGHLHIATRLMVGGGYAGGLSIVMLRGITEGIDLVNLDQFLALVLILALVGLFSNQRTIIIMTIITNIATVALLNLSPRLHPKTDVVLVLHAVRPQITGIALVSEWFIASFMIALWSAYQHSLRDLIAAYEHERQLDNLKDQFITNINHELRTPMTTLHGYIELLRLKRQNLSESEVTYALEKASQSGTAFIQLMSGILDAQRVEQDAKSLEHTDVALQPVITNALDMAGLAEMSGRAIHITLPTGIAVWGDPTAVQQILTNLLSNARKYSSSHSAISISAHYLAQKESNNGATTHLIEIRVRDAGRGIPPDEVSLLFNRFVRLPRDLASTVPGNGVGLFLCRVLTEAMNGTIGVESTGVEGEGSTFWVRLPAAPENVTANGKHDAETARIRSQWALTRPRPRL
jgi:signal transduction histidine kinase